MDVRHVQEVILEGGVVVVTETTWCGVVEGDVDVGNGKAAVVSAEGKTYSRWLAEDARGGGHASRERERREE